MILLFRFLPVPKGYSSFQHINHLDIDANQMHIEENAESFVIAALTFNSNEQRCMMLMDNIVYL